MLSLHLPSAVTLLPGVLLHFWSVRENAFGTSGKKLAVHFLSRVPCALGTFVNVADKYLVPNDELKEWLRVSVFLIGTEQRSYSQTSVCTGTCIR